MRNAAFNPTDELIARVCSAFSIPGEYVGSEIIPTGNVNGTYKTVYKEADGTVSTYIVQSLNRQAFKNAELVMHNIDLVAAHLRGKNSERRVLNFHHTKDALPYLEAEGGVWRICDYIPSRTLNGPVSAAAVREAGRAFGEFQRLLSDLPADGLYETIPDFHNTRRRFQRLFADAEADSLGRVSGAVHELETLRSFCGGACVLTDMLGRGELPLRITHNDTKINNLLFDPVSVRAIAVIDLDTVMPGLAAHDYGDAIRFAANSAGEEHTDAGGVFCDLGVVRAFTEGFLEQTRSMLTAAELETLALGPFVMTTELACRFLDDYLTGDTYFRTDFPGQNLMRARCQLALAEDIRLKQSSISKIIFECGAAR